MKILFKTILVASLLLTLFVPAYCEDAVSSASTTYFYGDTALTGDALMDAINSFSGFYLVGTTNPDGMPNTAFFIYGCTKLNDVYYLRLNLAENQTHDNLQTTGQAVAVYAASPSAEAGAKPYAVSGARMHLSLVTDETLLAKLNPENASSSFFLEVTEILPLG